MLFTTHYENGCGDLIRGEGREVRGTPAQVLRALARMAPSCVVWGLHTVSTYRGGTSERLFTSLAVAKADKAIRELSRRAASGSNFPGWARCALTDRPAGTVSFAGKYLAIAVADPCGATVWVDVPMARLSRRCN